MIYTCEERCDFTWLIGYSCAHCLGHKGGDYVWDPQDDE